MPLQPVIDALTSMQAKDTRVVVLTRGDSSVQDPKKVGLSQAGLDPDEFIVVPTKSETDFTDIMTANNVSPEQTLVVGDSYSSDIAPAMSVGVQRGIHLACADTWSPLEAEAAEYEVHVATSYEEAALEILRLI